MVATLDSLVVTKSSGVDRRRIPELDGVRGLAILLVLIYHYANLSIPGKTALYYVFLPTHLMWSGVDLFFVLSGFLIGGILLDHRESRGYYSVFYARRISRIFPLYYVMIALAVGGVWAFPRSPLFAGRMPMWTYLFFAQNLMGDFTRASAWLGVTWSLAVEEQFYLTFPAMVQILSRKSLLALMGACVIGAPILRTVLVFHGLRLGGVHALLPCRADALALGVIAAILVRTEAAAVWIKGNSRVLYGCLLALLIAFPTMLKWTTYWYVGTIGYSIIGLTYFLLIVLLLLAPIPLARTAFNAGWLQRLGVISYCVYLIHVPMRVGFFLLFRLGDEPSITGLKTLLATIASMIATIAIAQVSWVVLEKPLIRRAHVHHQY